MASDGLLNRAKMGTCRMCFRSRCTEKHVKIVGTVSHGFAVGHIWECIDIDDCDTVQENKLKKYSQGTLVHEKISAAKKQGRAKEFIFRS